MTAELDIGTIEVTGGNDSDQDEPAKAHLSIQYAIEDGDPTMALCGARMIGIDITSDTMPKCQECKQRYESIKGVKILNG